MAQIAVDAKGNKIRWDETKKEWVPVEKAVNDKGTAIEFDGAKWNPVYKTQPKQPVVDKITTAPPKKKTFMEQIKDVNWSRGGRVLGPRDESLEIKSLKDIGQAIGGAVTGLAAFPVSTAASAWAMTPKVGGPTLPPELAERMGQEIGGKITIKPTTPGAKAGAEALATPFAPFGAAINAMPTPELRVALSVAMLIYPYAKGVMKGMIGKRIQSGRGIAPGEVDAVVKNIKDLPPDVAAKAKSTRLQDPPTPTGRPAEDAAALEKFNAEQRAAEASRPGDAGAFPKPDIPPVKPGEIQPFTVKPIEGINQSPEQLLANALKSSKIIQPQQKALYRQERGERIGRVEDLPEDIPGQQRFYAKKGILKDPLKKVEFEPLDVPQAAKDALHDQIHYSKALRGYEKVGAGDALEAMLRGERFPSTSEVKLLNKVFGGELMDTLIKQMSTKDKIWYWGGQIANIPRTLMASFDLSAPFRQGIFLIGRPKKFFGAFGSMFKSFAKEANYSKVMSEISNRPTYELMRESGLDITAVKSSLKVAEEPFMGGDIIARGGTWAKKNLPSPIGDILDIIPKGVEASQRAYTAFLNKLRADVFDSLTNNAKELGLYDIKGQGGEVIKNLNANPKLSQEIAWYINAATGRGRLPDLAMKSSDVLNAVFFSPRLMSSRLTLLNPATYLNPARSSFVRLEAFGDFAKFYAFYTTVSMLAYLKAKEHLGTDPRSADYAKIKWGNTRIDFGGGFGQYVRTAIQASMPVFKALGIVDEAELVSSKTGKRTKIGGGFNETSVREILTRFITQKQSPIASLIWDALGQRSSEGKPIKIGKELQERITPMIVEDIIAASKDDPNQFKAVLVGALVAFGAGAQTYGPDAEKTFLDQSGKPYRGGDRVIDELNRLGVKAGIGTKAIKGSPITDPDIGKILEQGGDEVRKRILFYMDNPAYKNATDEQKKVWLQKAVEAGRKAAKDKYRLGVK